MPDHVIVCGAGATGGYVVDELIAARNHVTAIDQDPVALRELEERHPGELLRCITGDPTDEGVLALAELSTARGLAAVMPDDKDNIYVIVEARLFNPKAKIIATATARSHVDKLRRVGADVIVNPGYIGGLRMVSEMLRPTVVRFLDDMLRDTRSTWRIEEAHIEAGSQLVGVTLAKAAIRTRFGMTVLAIGRGGPWVYNPKADEQLSAGTILVVLGTVEQVAELRAAGRAQD
ncbi:MAG: TrkA family potassium uptake protein [Deltaproteobacteria bacterium]|nr:TrkA family potassium uptake protein [Deltaproteobacteria bacterium]